MQQNKHYYLPIILFLIIVIIVLGGALFYAFFSYKKLAVRPSLPPVVYEPAYFSEISFNLRSISQGFGEEVFTDLKKELEAGESDFIAVNLSEMKLELYLGGKLRKEIKVLSKGKEGSWWETPTGRYSVMSKESNHFSSIGRVWMPWSIQFHGNFFIHGWPQYSDGKPVSKEYSGGCIRISTDDAKEVFDFAKRNTPIIVYDRETKPILYQKIEPLRNELTVPQISGGAAFILDLDTGNVLLNKNSDEILPIASLTKFMTAVIASELIYLERSIVIVPEMLSAKIQSYSFEIGKSYRAFDLLYPLLMQSSNGAALALSSFLGNKFFVKQMNEKAFSLSMKQTVFADPSGESAQNVSTLKDLSRLVKYILEKRSFIFDISRGKDYPFFGSNVFKNIQNYNDFYDSPNLIGVKNGKTNEAKQTILTIWQLKTKDGKLRNVMIGILGSLDRKADTQILLDWLKVNFGLE
ncbi:MAG: L,D-transpeptidase family protein [Patescibacteria group bacterium]|nr:L,D-transpeptidase family protein [Patescibacteria group bacterium]